MSRTRPCGTAARKDSAVPRAASLAANVPTPGIEFECDGEGVECRINTWDGQVYSLRQLRAWCKRVDLTDEEVIAHWRNNCKPLAAAEAAGTSTLVSPESAHQVEEFRRVWTVNSLERMWSSADFAHAHAVSGIGFSALGLFYLLSVAAHDLGVSAAMPATEVAVAALALGAFNAASGLQPALLAKPKDLSQVLGLGEGANLKTGGFVNASLFYFVLAYQGLRVLPLFPPALALLDPVVGLASLLAVLHTGLIFNGWVEKGSIHRVDALLVPNALNLPVSLHLLLQGQAWVEELSAAYPGFPEAFFTANFAMAWSLSMVTLILSLYERRVISLELRGYLMLGLPLLTFGVATAHLAQLVPSWFGGDWVTMFTLIPPS